MPNEFSFASQLNCYGQKVIGDKYAFIFTRLYFYSYQAI